MPYRQARANQRTFTDTLTMPSPTRDATKSSRMLHLLDAALDQSHDVKAEVEA